MSTTKPPREFWLLKSLNEFGDRNKFFYRVFESYGEATAIASQEYPKAVSVIHVIEASALDDLQKKVDSLERELEAALAKEKQADARMRNWRDGFKSVSDTSQMRYQENQRLLEQNEELKKQLSAAYFEPSETLRPAVEALEKSALTMLSEQNDHLKSELEAIKAGSPKPRKGDWD